MKQNKNCYVDMLNWAHEHKRRAITDCIMVARYVHTTDNLDNRLSLEEGVISTIIDNDPDYH
jgi:hypothetical protein